MNQAINKEASELWVYYFIFKKLANIGELKKERIDQNKKDYSFSNL